MNKAVENENKLVSERYAQALLELVSDNLSKEDILKELLDITESVKGSGDLNKVMTSPVISNDEKKNVISKLFENTTNKVILNFLKLLVDKNRFSMLESITKEYKNEINRLNNLLSINVTSAIDLTEDEKSAIKDKLSNILNKNIELEWATNPDKIGRAHV